MAHYILEVSKQNIREHRLASQKLLVSPSGNQALLKVERFAMTANNITYAMIGEAYRYWEVFPAPEGWGRVPCWGIAEVAESDIEGLSIGDRFFGYLPMATELVIQPEQVTDTGFVDASSHRAHMAPLYNQYLRVSEQNGFISGFEDHHILYAGLFNTGFLLYHTFTEQQFKGADALGLISASSKTALGLAAEMKRNSCPTPIIGFTSAKNKAFVESLNLYDQVFSYDEIANCDATQKLAVADFSGNPDLVKSLRQHYADNLVWNMGVGLTHWEQPQAFDELPTDPTMEQFFAPDVIVDLQNRWGIAAYNQQLGQAWQAFASQVDQWIEITHLENSEGLTKAYELLLDGAPPNKALVVLPQ